MKKAFRAMAFSHKLVLVVLVPVLALSWFALREVSRTIHTSVDSVELLQLIKLSVNITALMHELQEERGMSARVLISNSTSVVSDLLVQRRATDRKIAELEAFLDLSRDSGPDPEIISMLDLGRNRLNGLEDERERITTLNISATDAIDYYGRAIDIFMKTINLLPKLSNDAGLSIGVMAFGNFQRGKERAGLERAIGYAYFADQVFGVNVPAQLATLQREQAAYTNVFLSLATDEQADFFTEKMSRPEIAEVIRMRDHISLQTRTMQLTGNLRAIIGYGGMIHELKNYLLRDNYESVRNFSEKSQQASRILGLFRNLRGISEETVQRVQVIEEMLDNYQRALEMAIAMKRSGRTIVEIDAAIQVDDDSALEAIEYLANIDHSVEPVDWFNNMTAMIGLLKEVDERLSADLQIQATAIRDNAFSRSIAAILVAVVAIAAVTLLGMRLVRTLVRQLGADPARLQYLAVAIAGGDLSLHLDNTGPATGVYAGMLTMQQALIEAKKQEQQLSQARKLESIGQLAAGIAHEINTPSQFVGDNTRFLQEAFGDVVALMDTLVRLTDNGDASIPRHEIRQALEDADVDYIKAEIPRAIEQSLEGVDRITVIVRAMKEFSHPAQEKTQLDLNRALESTITVASNEWKYVAEIELDLDPELPPVVCLPGEFNQVILNMIVNASHAIADVVGDSGKSKGAIKVSTRHVDNWAEIRIADTGSGMPKDVQERVFDPFFTTKDVGKGTGQGLSIAYKAIVENHGGTIAVDSEPGRGTCFTIRLPLEASLPIDTTVAA